MNIIVMKPGHDSEELTLAAGSTVDDALRKTSLDNSGCKAMLNGSSTHSSQELSDGDLIQLTVKVEGGGGVTVLALDSGKDTVQYEAGMTVGQVLAKTRFADQLGGKRVTLDGKSTSFSARVSCGQTITLSEKVEGGN